MPVPAFPIRPAEHMFQGSAGRPASSNPWAKLAFYNIGWLAASKKERHTKEGLATEICIMVRDKGVDAVGICEVFNLKDDMRDKREIIMQHLVTKLNSSAAQPAWAGRSDGHYIFLWNSRKLVLRKYDYVSCGVEEHPWRMAQYFQFHRAQLKNDSPLHVCHNHSPSSRPNCILTEERRKLFSGRYGTMCCNKIPAQARCLLQSSLETSIVLSCNGYNASSARTSHKHPGVMCKCASAKKPGTR